MVAILRWPRELPASTAPLWWRDCRTGNHPIRGFVVVLRLVFRRLSPGQLDLRNPEF